MAISKRVRELVYNKYDGHCAYCGKKITIKEMQVDHLYSKFRYDYIREEALRVERKGEMSIPLKEELAKMPTNVDNISNLMPACRQCNFRKSSDPLETFRSEIREQAKRLMESSFQARMSAQYGLIEYHDHPIKFFFETYKVLTTREIEYKLINSPKCAKIMRDFGERNEEEPLSPNLVRFINKMFKEGRMMKIWNKLKEYGEV